MSLPITLLHSNRVNELLYAPVIEKYWRQCELWDGTYTFRDWLDIVDYILVTRANTRAIEEYKQSQRAVRK